MLFLGDDLLAWIVLALGGAMVVGPLAALLRPRPEHREGELDRPPVGRTLAFALVGLVGVVWALATLVAS